MTDNENVTSVEVQNEPVPNPYNQKKSWQTDNVMPKEGKTATSLFVEPQPAETIVSEEKGETQQAVSTDKPYKKADYKKRYDDLKKHYDTKLNEFRGREQELIQEATASRPEYIAPKTVEELERFKAQYPDVYDVVETVSHLQSEAKTEELKTQLNVLQERETATLRREAENELLNKHPDFANIRESDEFHQWAKEQPTDIQAWVYNNPNNVSLATRAIDLFKQDMGISQNTQAQKRSTKSNSTAADMVSTKTTTVDAAGEPKIWTQEEISNLSMDQFDKYEKDIDQAVLEGRVRG
tara:strand:- start:442 stop:1329 length:888 start_codon:yes stop_codon:yes gene_type:complete